MAYRSPSPDLEIAKEYADDAKKSVNLAFLLSVVSLLVNTIDFDISSFRFLGIQGSLNEPYIVSGSLTIASLGLLANAMISGLWSMIFGRSANNRYVLRKLIWFVGRKGRDPYVTKMVARHLYRRFIFWPSAVGGALIGVVYLAGIVVGLDDAVKLLVYSASKLWPF